MRLDYGTQLSPCPISLSIGTIKKPTLSEISQITFGKFNLFEVFLKLTPEMYYTKILDKEADSIWKSMSDEQKESADLYSMILVDSGLQEIYVDLLNFFFEEDVIYHDGYFIIVNKGTATDEINKNSIRGIIQKESFSQILDILQQICCIHDKEENVEEMKFKNKKAREIYEKIRKGQQAAAAKHDINLSIPNIISAVACKHPSLNLVNIWDLTIFQLLDSFSRLQENAIYDINSARVSSWGDEKKTFDAALWYKNNYDKTN